MSDVTESYRMNSKNIWTFVWSVSFWFDRVFLGEAGKYVTASATRFAGVSATGSGMQNQPIQLPSAPTHKPRADAVAVCLHTFRSAQWVMVVPVLGTLAWPWPSAHVVQQRTIVGVRLSERAAH